VPEQLALGELIRIGGYARQVRRSRLHYRRRRERMIAALAREVPGVRVTGVAAGLHVLIELPDRACEQDAVARLCAVLAAERA
jgi:GntR family transcriptional regulator / MocR family aminotransferase